ncbi:ethanolamine ammonia-lyase subunit EutC [Parasediminibacterium sp. JCM 36343]|uniref:ethanolamine ammonia-lyase subunit EutC n=1 Tax=Parasediminibacterium sp. JCM 36343 TaxID=3374279 RepID=UPI00397815D8
MPLDKLQQSIIQEDPWTKLQSFTQARIALGRAGVSIPLQENLQFRLAHAHARDAVYSGLALDNLATSLQALRLPVLQLHCQCANRQVYLQGPDLGRRLNAASNELLKQLSPTNPDIAIVLADGLSATAINENALPLLQILIPVLKSQYFSVAPICIVEQARVAIADEIGSLLQAKLSIIFIGERPGLSSPNSMGAYITYNPSVGLTDESRNCISNIRPEGLPYQFAAEKILYLIKQSLRLKLSGVGLKDESGSFGELSNLF